MAYGAYVAAALLVNAGFPEFLRDHLFDGMVLAGLVGLLVTRSLRPNPFEAFPRVRRPVMFLVIYSLTGAAIFALIAALAVFVSGSSDYGNPIVLCAFIGGYVFFWPFFFSFYMSVIGGTRRQRWLAMIKWWFTKLPPGFAPQEVTEPVAVRRVASTGAEAASEGPGKTGATD
jgi:hypothetical protein